MGSPAALFWSTDGMNFFDEFVRIIAIISSADTFTTLYGNEVSWNWVLSGIFCF
jgi:hypothetical protein